jgi:hypothetical protein
VRESWPDLEGVGIWRSPAGSPLQVRIVEEPAPSVDDAAIESRWRVMCAANPRLHDGPILSVVRLEGDGIVCRRDTYRRLAVQPEVLTGVEQLSVTGVVLGRDENGRDAVLLGRRGRQTRIYGGMWELGPSGGIDPPLPEREELGVDQLLVQLHQELREEIGSAWPVEGVEVFALCHDAVAHSYDIVMRCMSLAPLPLVESDNWEYERLRWVALESLADFDREHAAEIIAPTRAIFRVMGWA